MPNIYVIRQDSAHLYGDILDTAVVVAESVKEARQLLSKSLHAAFNPLTWDQSGWAIFKVGNNGKVPSSDAVLCMNTQYRPGLPPGNYNPIR